MRIVSYNTQAGFANGRQLHDWEAQASLLATYSADVIALQEVAIRHPQGKPIDYPAEVARTLGMNYLFAEAMPLKPDGHYGVGLLSRYPLEHVATIQLPVPQDIEPRVALVARVLAPTPFCLVSTHLSYHGEFPGDDEGRVRQMGCILDFLEANRLFPIILAGDLNTAPNAPALQALRRKFEVFNDNRDARPTAKTSKFGWLQIDYIAGTPSSAISCTAFRVGDDCRASDHYAVIADVEITAATTV